MRAYFDPSGEPRVEIEVAGNRSRVAVAAILDTGFNGELSLPLWVAIQLGLELRGMLSVELADGSVSDELALAGHLVDEGQATEVRILLTHAEDALLGTRLLRGRRVVLDFGAGRIEIGP